MKKRRLRSLARFLWTLEFNLYWSIARKWDAWSYEGYSVRGMSVTLWFVTANINWSIK